MQIFYNDLSVVYQMQNNSQKVCRRCDQLLYKNVACETSFFRTTDRDKKKTFPCNV